MRFATAFLSIALGALIAPASLTAARAGQTPRQGPPAFDVVSVKPVAGSGGRPGFPVGVSTRSVIPGGLRVTAASLAQLIEFAYAVKSPAVQLKGLAARGPAPINAWMRTDRWSVQARTRPGSPSLTANLELARKMTQRLLADRFGLKIKTETQTLPVYELRLAGPQSKHLTPAQDPSQPHIVYLGGPQVFAEAITMRELAGTLSYFLDRPVIDDTGLTGTYQFKVDTAPVPPGTPMLQASIIQDRELLRALGLKFVSANAPVTVYVVLGAARPHPD